MNEENSLLTGAVRPALLRYALPIILSMVATQFYAVADTMIIGLRLDADALAAVSNASTMLMIFLFVSGGMELGGGLLVAAGKPTATKHEMTELLYNLLFVDEVIALLTTAVGFVTLPALLRLINTPAEILDTAVLYGRIYLLGLPFLMPYDLSKECVMGCGDSKTPLKVIVATSVMNIVLDLVLVGPFGVAGAAAATAAAQVAGAVYMVAFLRRTQMDAAFSPRMLKARYARDIFRLSAPNSVQQASGTIITTVKQGLLGGLGVEAIAGFSCAGAIDRISPYSIPPEAVTEADLPAMRMGVYSGFQSGGPGVRSYIMFDILGGNIRGNSGTSKDQINSMLSSLNSYQNTSWAGYFYILYHVNTLIKAAEKYPGSSEATLPLGDSHYFRAYLYYCMVTRWGDMPILRENTQENVPRDPAEQVWNFIEEELELALDLLGSSKSYYYVSHDAAVALMARVKLSRGKKTEAAELAESLIGKYKLDDFEKIFRKAANTEIIFAFENLSEESGLNISDLFYTYAHENKGQGVYYPTKDLLAVFSDEDKRKEITFTSVAGQTLFNKYPSGQTGKDPVIVSRVAEMYLISAEAQGRPNGLARLNDLREVRGLTAINRAPTTDKAFMDAVMDERRRELVTENFRYYDLVRTGRAVEELGIQSHQVLFPIPGQQRLLNPLLGQNPGYGD